jgi:hypothetical protein
MPTTPFGIWYPGSSDAVTPLETAFSTMASSIDNVLAGNVQIHRVANTTERNALVSQFPPSAANPLVVWRANATNGQELEYTKNGTTWHYVNTSEDDTGWVALTTSSGGSTGLAVRRIGSQVYLQGEVWGVTAGATLFTLAPQFRPTVRKAYPAVRAGGGTAAIGGDARVYIQTSGEVRMHNFTSMPGSSPGIDISQTWLSA